LTAGRVSRSAARASREPLLWGVAWRVWLEADMISIAAAQVGHGLVGIDPGRPTTAPRSPPQAAEQTAVASCTHNG
jgi:hypothetical protein